MTTNREENAELSATSPGDDSDGALSPVAEQEPKPGIDGAPVRCMFLGLVLPNQFIHTFLQGMT